METVCSSVPSSVVVDVLCRRLQMISIVHQQSSSFTNSRPSRRCCPSFRSDAVALVAVVRLRFSIAVKFSSQLFTFVSHPHRRRSISDFVRFISIILHPDRRQNPSIHPHCRQSPPFD
ncbi:hypothetical protein RHSIM_Rhsim11G0119800 [Rhododendron simsii]|uniref:Uncharacterized protein n=1 Tax=Rhododendron simsii TaxID=118357 RepID=A0A834G5I6_RHOSS|nr:hypothetical protein RHSIM_Rhsim11G0119800 [Rhododendron simsii]